MYIRTKISLFLIFILLGGCSDAGNASVTLSGLNYTNVAIAEYSVDGYGGGGVFANGGGGQFVCCVSLPSTWQPEMRVTIRWTVDSASPTIRKQKIVLVPKYEKQDIGFFAVHFYPNDRVEVLVTKLIEGHPDYLYPRPKK